MLLSTEDQESIDRVLGVLDAEASAMRGQSSALMWVELADELRQIRAERRHEAV